MKTSHLFRLLALAFCATLLSSCSDAPKSSLVFSSCRVGGLSQAVQCATLEVPRDRNVPNDSRRLALKLVKLPSTAEHPNADPFLMLAGGPGQSAESLAPFAAALVNIRKTRDIYLLNPRGAGANSPLRCEAFDAEQKKPNEFASSKEELKRVHVCLEELQKKKVDPLNFGTLAFVDDIDAMRVALGAKVLNIWGGSYGTRVALEYLRKYPEHVRTMILDGVLPPDKSIVSDGSQNRETTLKRFIVLCAKDANCEAKLPDIQNALARLEKRLSRGGEMDYRDPATGVKRHARLDFATVVSALQSLLYSPENSALAPLILERASKGDFNALAAFAEAFNGETGQQINPALYYAVTCAEDSFPVKRQASKNVFEQTRNEMIASCDGWPKARLPKSWGKPVVNENVPVLLLSGQFDPVTPPRFAEEVSKTLKNSESLVASGFAHIVSARSCAPDMIAGFVHSADLKKLPEKCVRLLEQKRPPMIWTDGLGNVSGEH